MEVTKEHATEERKPRRVLITGLPGSGKSRLSQYLTSKGYNAVDADKAFLTYNGESLPFAASMKWLIKNYPRWERAKFDAVMEQNKDKDLYVVGVVPNMLKFLDKFDEIYYLKASKEILTYRLSEPRSDNNYGTTEVQKKLAVSLVPVANVASKLAGFTFVDASMKTEDIFAKICTPPAPK